MQSKSQLDTQILCAIFIVEESLTFSSTKYIQAFTKSLTFISANNTQPMVSISLISHFQANYIDYVKYAVNWLVIHV